MNPVGDKAIISAVAQFFRQPDIDGNLASLARRLPPAAEIYVAGGAPRNIVISVLHGQGPPIADLDIFIGKLAKEFSLQASLKGEALRPTDLKGFRWQPAGSDLAYDLSLLSDFVGIQAVHLEPTLETLLHHIDFTINAIAYDVGSQRLFENGAVAAVQRRVIEFNSRLVPDKQLMAYRILIMHHKTGFMLSSAVFQFLKQQLDLTAVTQLERLFKAKLGHPLAAAIMKRYDSLCRHASYRAYRASIETWEGNLPSEAGKPTLRWRR